MSVGQKKIDGKNKRTARGLVLFSGGLDSILAAKILQAQKIEISPICFESYFFDCAKAKIAAAENGLPLRVVDISEKHLAIVKKPKHGRGAGANPCIDCHLLMLKTAREIMEAEGFDFVATGEVLGQRPMSQNKLSLEIIERESGLAGKLLRPLSAKLLPETGAETRGLVDRGKLFDIFGRSRQAQLALAQKYGIKNIPQPAGGCVLTDPEYGRRLKDLMAKRPDFCGNDAEILRCGRIFWVDDFLIVVARDKNECDLLKEKSQKGDWVFEPENFSGPAVLIRGFGAGFDFQEIVALGKKYVFLHSNIKKIPADPKIRSIGSGK
jgi:tRNA U34 2-thiouridine synthase MnmA/TrmU